jgi:hypothetical protein
VKMVDMMKLVHDICVKPIELGRQVMVKPYGEAKVDMVIPDNDDLRINTLVHGDTESVTFETTDHEGNILGDSWEVSWPEIHAAIREWCRK